MPWNSPRTPRKHRFNGQKHRISFDTALHVFDDPYHVTTQHLLVAHVDDDETGAVGLFQPETQLAPNGESMPKATRKSTMQVGTSPKALNARQRHELVALAVMPDDQIETSDISELPASAWKDAVRGRFYRPLKKAVSMRLDADVVAWLKKRGKGYQTRANSILRQRMLDETKRA